MFTRCRRLLAGLVGIVAMQGAPLPFELGSWWPEQVALAEVRKDPLDLAPTERTGDPGNLPVGCRTSPEELVHWARHRMPDVQVAIDEFARRGYVSVPAGDTAVTGCARGVPFSGVTLAFVKPGAFIDSAHVVAPMILVTTRLHILTGEPFTQVSGGLMVGDGEAGLVYSADSLGMFRDTDPSFDVRLSTVGGARKRDVSREGMFDIFRDNGSSFNQFVRCAGWGTIACVATAIRFGGPVFRAMKLAVLLGQPELGLALLGSCALVSALGCFGQ
jgi:hypothetical protein